MQQPQLSLDDLELAGRISGRNLKSETLHTVSARADAFAPTRHQEALRNGLLA